MPDLSIAYKLHLECGKLINLYDWLQAFLTIVDPIDDDDADEERREVNPKIQYPFKIHFILVLLLKYYSLTVLLQSTLYKSSC